mmetsp:Transcript_43216/g.97675  ORF Transcript_43216/g.97675 Transcript_43216/m.97675 type:complete len:208 (+) Transcript_43216:21-644(+)
MALAKGKTLKELHAAHRGLSPAVVGGFEGARAPAAAPPAAPPSQGRRLGTLLRDIDPRFEFDSEAQDLVLQLAEDFIAKATKHACLLAKHRGATSVDVKDIRLVLEKQWDIRVPNVTGEKPPPPSSRPPYSRPPAGLQVLGSQRSRRAEKAQDKALGADGHGPGKAARGGDEGGEAAAGVEGGPESRGRSVSPPPPGKRQRSNQSKP